MNILLTGGNGFLGTYVKKAFQANPPFTIGLTDCNINCDLSITTPSLPQQINVVIHTAGKAHSIPRRSNEIKSYFNVNLQGTKNILRALEETKELPDSFVFISSVAVYGLKYGENIDELAPLKGGTPYADSKIQAENILLDWGRDKGVNILILRLPLLVGKNPPGNLGKLIKSIRNNYYLRICSGTARRSMVLADDIGTFIGSVFGKIGIFNLTDGDHPNIREIEEIIANKFKKKIKSIPYSLIKVIAKAGDITPIVPINSDYIDKITTDLTFSDRKAREILGWSPRKVKENLHLYI